MRAGSRAVAASLRPAALGVRSLARAPGLTLVGWHRVDGERTQGLSTGLDDFQRQLDLLDSWGAAVLPLEVAVEQLRAGTLPPRAVALTFDDGYASVVETAWPLLRARSWSATLFVVAASLINDLRFAWDGPEADHQRVRLATRDELVDAADDGLDIGSHTLTHPWLPNLDEESRDDELVRSRVLLEEALGRPITSIAYPSGGWDVATRDAAERAGYRRGITVDRGLNTQRSNPLSLRRAFVPERLADFRLLLDGAYTFLRPVDRWRVRGGPVW